MTFLARLDARDAQMDYELLALIEHHNRMLRADDLRGNALESLALRLHRSRGGGASVDACEVLKRRIARWLVDGGAARLSAPRPDEGVDFYLDRERVIIASRTGQMAVALAGELPALARGARGPLRRITLEPQGVAVEFGAGPRSTAARAVLWLAAAPGTIWLSVLPLSEDSPVVAAAVASAVAALLGAAIVALGTRRGPEPRPA